MNKYRNHRNDNFRTNRRNFYKASDRNSSLEAILFSLMLIFVTIEAKKGGKCNVCDDVCKKTTSTIENNTLVPSTSCSYHISPENGTVPIRILLKKLLLDSKDNLTITHYKNTSKPLFPVFHGQNEAVLLVTEQTQLTVYIEVSQANDITRHLEFLYDGIATECTMKVDNDMPTIQQPLFENKTVDCSLTYDAKFITGVRRSFTFDAFNLENNSFIEANDVENPKTKFSGKDRPQELFAMKGGLTGDTKFTFKINPNDSFILRQHHLNDNCSGFQGVDNEIKLNSAVTPKLDNGSLVMECRWLLQNKNPDKSLKFSLESAHFNHPYDVLVINDGSNSDSNPLYEFTSSNIEKSSDTIFLSSTDSMVVSFKPYSVYSNFTASVQTAGQGKFLKTSGTIQIQPNDETGSYFLLEVNQNETVVLTFNNADITGIIDIYDDFSLKSNLIATLNSEIKIWYPIISTTHRMMLHTRQNKNSALANFKGSIQGCTHMSQGSNDNYILSENYNSTCQWVIPPIAKSDSDLIINLQYLALETTDKISIYQLDNKTPLTIIFSNLTHVPQLKLDSQKGALLKIERGLSKNQTKDIVLVAQSIYMPKCSEDVKLATYQTTYLTSPNFPNTYPLLMKCEKQIISESPKQLIHIGVSKLHLASGHSLNFSSGSEKESLTGDKLPDDLFFFNGNVTMDFDSSVSGKQIQSQSLVTDQGFMLNVTAVDCGGIVSNSSGKIVSVANKTLCMWLIKVPATNPKEKDSVNTITFTVNGSKIGNYDLKIYNGGSVRAPEMDIAKELWSRTNSLIVVYKPINISKPASEITITYATETCNKTMQCNNSICLHPSWRCNGVNDCGDFSDEADCSGEPVGPTTPPSPSQKGGGVSATTFAIVIIIMFVLGVVLAIVLPNAYRKYQNSRYSQFRDVSVIE